MTDSKPRAPRSTQAEFNQRVSEVQDLLLEGRTRSHIIQYGSKWGVVDRQVDEYISEARKILKEINQESLQDNLATISNALWDVYRKAKAAQNLGEQRQVLAQLAKLKGLDQQVINHVIEDKRELENLSNEELDAILSSTTEE